MDGDNRLKLIVAGLFLAAIAVGYLIFSQRFTSNSNQTTNVNRPVVQSSPTPVTTAPPPSPSSDDPSSLSDASIPDTTKGGQPLPTTKGGLPNTGISSLPATGAPAGLIAIFGVSVSLAGYFLRRYPH